MAAKRAMRSIELGRHRAPNRRIASRQLAHWRAAAPALPDDAFGAEPTWPSECEILSRINGASGAVRSIGEQYLEAAFFVSPRARA